MEKGKKATANVNRDRIPGTQMDEQCPDLNIEEKHYLVSLSQ
jgi:hypothetical protein